MREKDNQALHMNKHQFMLSQKVQLKNLPKKKLQLMLRKSKRLKLYSLMVKMVQSNNSLEMRMSRNQKSEVNNSQKTAVNNNQKTEVNNNLKTK
jgi:hypothetical protein